jgi:hypothetical protein
VNTQKGAYRNGFVSGAMRLQRSPCGESPSWNHHGAAKKGELKFAPAYREPHAANIAVRSGSAGRHP